jgi:hypothetical protein
VNARIPRLGLPDAPLSFAQEGHRFLGRLAGGQLSGGFRNLFLLCRVENPDIGALEEALNLVVRRHEALRISLLPGRPEVQSVCDAARVRVRHEKVPGTTPLERLDAAIAFLDAELDYEFDYSSGCLIRALLMVIEGYGNLLSVTVDHLSTDPESLGILLRELNAAYAAIQEGRHPDLPELEIQYNDFASWQRGPDNEAAVAANKNYWTSRLVGLPEVHLPFGDPSERAPWSTSGAVERVVVPRQEHETADVLRRLRISPATLLLVATYASLVACGVSDDITVGATGSYRPRPETRPLIGTFACSPMCFIRMTGFGNASLAAAGANTQRSLLTGLRHTGLSVTDLLAPDVVESINRTRYPWVLVNFREVLPPSTQAISPVYPGELRARRSAIEPLDEDETQNLDIGPVDLHVRVLGKGDEYQCEVFYNEAVFPREIVGVLAEKLTSVLRLSTGDEDRSLLSLANR